MRKLAIGFSFLICIDVEFMLATQPDKRFACHLRYVGATYQVARRNAKI